MADLRIAGLAPGAAQNMSATYQGQTASASVASYKLPPFVSDLPRITGVQYAGETVGLDTGSLTGPFTYQWRCTVCGDLGTDATQVLPNAGHNDPNPHIVTCDVTHAAGSLTTPGIAVYASMDMEIHNVDDKAALALCPHDDATHIAVSDGSWTSASTWHNGEVPGPGARVLISYGLTVNYDRNAPTLRLDWLRIDGKLTHATDQTTAMLVDTRLNTQTGEIEDGTSTNRVKSNVTHELIISARDYRTSNGFEDSDIDLFRDPKLIGRGDISQGKRTMWAAERDTKHRVTIAPMIGATSCTLDTLPVGWQIGDRIVIGGTAPTVVSESEVRVITGINGAVISWADPLIYNHDHHNPAVTRTDLLPYVINLSSNIVIRSERPDVEPWRRGHTMDMHHKAIPDLWDVRHVNLGRTRKGESDDLRTGQITDAGEFEFPAGNGNILTTAPLTARSNIKGRYGVHAHFVGFGQKTTPIYHGCIVEDIIGWGFGHHSSHVHMNSCAAFEFDGSGFVSETGNELGEWLDCIAVKARIKETESPKVVSAQRDTQGDFGRLGYGFMMRSRALRFNRCVTMDTSWGAVLFYRDVPNASIIPLINHNSADVDIQDLQGSYRVTEIAVADYPLIHTADSEFIGSFGGGLFVSKDGREQFHGWNVNIKRLKSWGYNQVGLAVEYIGQYALTDFDVVCVDASFGGLRRGIEVSSETHQVSVVNPRTEQNDEGVRFDGNSVFKPLQPYSNDDPRYMIAGHTSVGDTTAIVDTSLAQGNPESLVVYPTLPTPVEPSITMPFVIADWDGSTGFGGGISNALSGGWNSSTQTSDNVAGTITDTVSSLGAVPKLADRMGIPHDSPTSEAAARDLNRLAERDGYWMYNGEPHLIFPLYVSDRLYGTPIKSIHAVRMTGSTSGYTNNGAYTISANAPISGDFSSISAPSGQTTIVDVVAACSDPDGGTLTLSPSYSGPDHGRLVINGDSVEYMPDPEYAGTDLAWVWVEDGTGHATRCDLWFNVS